MLTAIKTKRIYLSVLCLCLLVSTPAWGEERVLTIYFAGTSNTVNGAEYFLGLHKYHPELISTLYARDTSSDVLTSAGPKYKFFVDGVGTKNTPTQFPDCLGSAIDPLDTCILPHCCRGFSVCLADATEAFDAVGGSPELTLNLVGFSRGGVLPMMMARWVSDNARSVKKINILSFDPVPGVTTDVFFGDPIGQLGRNFTLPNIVNQYVGIYARDERSHRFEPIIPHYNSRYVDDMLVSVRGSHETMDGNMEVDGHSAIELPITDWMFLRDSRLQNHYNVSMAIAERLLSGVEWGEVELATSVFSGDEKTDFLSFVQGMYDYPPIEYLKMHSVSFLRLTFGTIDPFYEVLGRDHHLLVGSLFPPLHGRLAYRSNGALGYRHETEYIWWLPPFFWVNPDQVYSLDSVVDPIDGEKAWARLEYLRGEPVEVDQEPPIPVVSELPDIVGECEVTLTSDPLATDNVDGTIRGETTSPLSYTEQGTYEVVWTYVDQAGNSATQTQTIIVDDTMPPVPDLDPLPVVAGECSATVTSVPVASDNCAGLVSGYTSDPLAYTNQGDHTVTWSFDDGNGNMATQGQSVVVKDETPPVLQSVVASADVLWPPNHKMKTVGIDVKVVDNCDEEPACRITAVSCDERGDNWQVVGDHTVLLKAERDGKGDGRVYTVTESCTDAVGNSAQGQVSVFVPHDRRKR